MYVVFNNILVVCLTACSASMSSVPRDSPILSNLSKRPSIRKISCDNLSKMTVLSVSCFLSLAIFFSNVAHRIASSSISLGVNSLLGWVGRKALILIIFLDARIPKRETFLYLLKIFILSNKTIFLIWKPFLPRFRGVGRRVSADYAPHTTSSPPDSKSYLHLWDCITYSRLRDHPFKTSACLRGEGVPIANVCRC